MRENPINSSKQITGKIAFVRLGTRLPANSVVPRVLQRIFPEHEVEVIDVSRLITKTHKIVNLLFVLLYYGFDILCGHKKFRRCAARTPFIFNKMKQLIHGQLSKDTYLLSLQNQSLFDASTGKWPHFVYTDHTHLENLNYPGFGPKQLISKEWISLEESIYRNATVIFTRSSNISRSLMDSYSISPEKVVCIYAGSIVNVDRTKVESATYRQKYLRKNILFVGIDWERKGGPDLVEAFTRVREAHPEATLTIVGCTPVGTPPNCEVIGRVPSSKVNQYYEKATLFCLPTRLEPFGLVFVEAMAHRLPIIGTNVGAIPDMVREGKNGILVKPGDIDALANSLIHLLANPEICREYGRQSEILATERYSWDVVGKRMKQTMLRHL